MGTTKLRLGFSRDGEVQAEELLIVGKDEVLEGFGAGRGGGEGKNGEAIAYIAQALEEAADGRLDRKRLSGLLRKRDFDG